MGAEPPVISQRDSVTGAPERAAGGAESVERVVEALQPDGSFVAGNPATVRAGKLVHGVGPGSQQCDESPAGRVLDCPAHLVSAEAFKVTSAVEERRKLVHDLAVGLLGHAERQRQPCGPFWGAAAVKQRVGSHPARRGQVD